MIIDLINLMSGCGYVPYAPNGIFDDGYIRFVKGNQILVASLKESDGKASLEVTVDYSEGRELTTGIGALAKGLVIYSREIVLNPNATSAQKLEQLTSKKDKYFSPTGKAYQLSAGILTTWPVYGLEAQEPMLPIDVSEGFSAAFNELSPGLAKLENGYSSVKFMGPPLEATATRLSECEAAKPAVVVGYTSTGDAVNREAVNTFELLVPGFATDLLPVSDPQIAITAHMTVDRLVQNVPNLKVT